MLPVQFFIWSCFFQDRQLPLCVLPSSQWFLLLATCSGSDHCLARLYLTPGAAQPLNLRIQIFLFLRRVLPGSVLFYNSGSFRPSVHRLPSSGRCRVFHFLQDSILCCSFCRSGRYHLQSDLQCEKFTESFSDRSFLHLPHNSIYGNHLL